MNLINIDDTTFKSDDVNFYASRFIDFYNINCVLKTINFCFLKKMTVTLISFLDSRSTFPTHLPRKMEYCVLETLYIHVRQCQTL